MEEQPRTIGQLRQDVLDRHAEREALVAAYYALPRDSPHRAVLHRLALAAREARIAATERYETELCTLGQLRGSWDTREVRCL